MAEKGFFSEDGAHASGAKTVLTLENDEVMVYDWHPLGLRGY
jgi:hypothetical protein